jgi:Sortase domain
VSEAGRASRASRWALVAPLLAVAAVSAVVAALAARTATPVAGIFGPGLEGVPPVISATGGEVGGEVVRTAPVVAPSTGGRVASSGRAPAALEGPAYEVGAAPFRPTRIVLPNRLSARVSAVGIHDDGSLVVPDDPRVVGWWTGGSMAGEAYGSTVLAGHVDSASRGIGVLAALPRVRPGQVIELAAGDRNARYRVVSARLVPQARLSRAGGLFRTDGAAQLVLITCGGPFDPVRHRYADNYIVIARPSP